MPTSPEANLTRQCDVWLPCPPILLDACGCLHCQRFRSLGGAEVRKASRIALRILGGLVALILIVALVCVRRQWHAAEEALQTSPVRSSPCRPTRPRSRAARHSQRSVGLHRTRAESRDPPPGARSHTASICVGACKQCHGEDLGGHEGGGPRCAALATDRPEQRGRSLDRRAVHPDDAHRRHPRGAEARRRVHALAGGRHPRRRRAAGLADGSKEKKGA